ncbi:MAG: oligosaccharide flippase family protein [Chloroflexota bacterium]
MDQTEVEYPTLGIRILDLARRRVTGDLLMTFGGRWVQVLLGLVGSVVSARALGPSELGRFGLIISIIMVFGTLADAGLTYSAIRLIARGAEQDVYRAKAVARSYFFLRVLTGVSVALLGIPLSWPLAWALGYPDLVPYLQLAFLTLFSLSLSSYPGTILVGLSKFKEFSVAGILNAVITVAGILVLFFTGTLSLGTLIAWNVVLPLASSVPAWLLMQRDWLPWRIWAKPEPRLGDEVRRELVTFAKWIGVSLVGTMLVTQGDILLLGRLTNPAVVGIYSVALALASRLDTLNQSLFTVMMPRASRLEGGANMRRYWRRVALGSLVLAGALALAAVVAQPLIVLLYGERYVASAGLFFALLGMVLFDLATSSLFLLVFPLNRPRLLAAADWLRVVVLGTSGWLLIPVYGAFGAVVARLLARVIGTTVVLLSLRRSINEE